MRFVLLLPVAALVLVVACSSDADPATPAAATPTYEKDVYPILATSCGLASCHGSSQSGTTLGPPLGVHIPPADKDATYKDLVNVDSVRFVGTKLILPGDPENSLVMRKMDGTQAELASCPGDCGKSMPPPETATDDGSQLLSQKKRDKVRAWIKAGAAND